MAATISGHPGFAGVYFMKQIAWGRGSVLSLWDTAEDAVAAADRTAAVRGPRPFTLATDDVCQVLDDWSGSTSDEEPAAAALIHFDGPVSDARLAAATRGNDLRITPALARVPGIVRKLVLWEPVNRHLTIALLATSVDALDDAGRAVNSTELLPDEDAALMPGPDRVVPHHVIALRQSAVKP